MDLEIKRKVQYTIYLTREASEYIKELKGLEGCTYSSLIEALINFYKESKKNE